MYAWASFDLLVGKVPTVGHNFIQNQLHAQNASVPWVQRMGRIWPFMSPHQSHRSLDHRAYYPSKAHDYHSNMLASYPGARLAELDCDWTLG